MLLNFTHILQILQPYSVASIFILTYLAEHIIPQNPALIDHQHDFKNIVVGIINAVVIFLIGFYFQKFVMCYNQNQFGLLNWLSLPTWLKVLLSFIIIDIFLYWWHRSNHLLPFLWFFHKYHHADTKMNSTTAVRFHSGELLLSFVAKVVFFPIIGITLNGLLLHGLILFPVIVLHHSSIKINARIDAVIRLCIVSPHMHRIHHSIIKSETDSNYSSIFPFWDKLFKTYTKAPQKPIEFGI